MANLKKREMEILLMALDALWEECDRAEGNQALMREINVLTGRLSSVKPYHVNIPERGGDSSAARNPSDRAGVQLPGPAPIP